MCVLRLTAFFSAEDILNTSCKQAHARGVSLADNRADVGARSCKGGVSSRRPGAVSKSLCEQSLCEHPCRAYAYEIALSISPRPSALPPATLLTLGLAIETTLNLPCQRVQAGARTRSQTSIRAVQSVVKSDGLTDLADSVTSTCGSLLRLLGIQIRRWQPCWVLQCVLVLWVA